MDYKNPEALVTTDWLVKNIAAPNLSIVDASFFLPADHRDARKEFNNCHIPGAVFFDINEIADKSTNLPHMLPTENEFSHHVSNLGISNEHHVICYDANGGPMAAMRAWWSFRVFGHDRVSVLSGGLPKWQNENHAISSVPGVVTNQQFSAKRNKYLVKNIEQISENIQSQNLQMVDARSEGRYNGTEVEPRAGLRQGHIPGAINLPFEKLLDSKNFMTMRSADEILSIIMEAGIDPKIPLISSCGSGVTAAPLIMALYLIGNKQAAIYDGSWTEWAGRPDTPITI
jgi:thiosulfate/3-mercaptopyruvate sulfurtransferase